MLQYKINQTLLYDSENGIIETRDAKRITAAEMKYVRQTAGHTWADHKTNTEIAKELNMTPVLHKTQEYVRNWLKHTNGTPGHRLQRILESYRPIGRRIQGRPLTL